MEQILDLSHVMVQYALDQQERAPPDSLMAMLRAVDEVLARERKERGYRLGGLSWELKER